MGEVSGVNGAQQTVQPVKITIKKNQGITQALFDLVKNENLSGGKIDAGEWKNARSVLNEILANREKTGGANIYTGGAGNDGHKNYIVQEGQQIEFTAEEIQKLYNALGVTLKDEKSPQPAQDTTGADQTGQADGAGEVKQTPPKQDTPKSQTLKPRKTDCPGVFYDEATKTHYKIENGKYVEFKGKNGGKVRTVFDDGSYVECFYHKNGTEKIVNEINAKGQINESRNYNENGKLEKETHFKNGKPSKTWSYQYNPDGSYIEKYFKHNKGWKRNTIMKHNKDGKETGGVWYDGDKFTTRNLKNGDIIRKFINNDGSTKYYFYYPKNGADGYKCDANGNPIK